MSMPAFNMYITYISLIIANCKPNNLSFLAQCCLIWYQSLLYQSSFIQSCHSPSLGYIPYLLNRFDIFLSLNISTCIWAKSKREC